MTKYEWERDLKRNLAVLPSDEVAKVLDYYNELFEDMSEGGKSEQHIIREFGNPFDVARRIMDEFEQEYGEIESGESEKLISGYTQAEVDEMSFFKAVKINVKNTLNKVKRKLVGVNGNHKGDTAESSKSSLPVVEPPSFSNYGDNRLPVVREQGKIDSYSPRLHGRKGKRYDHLKQEIEREREELERQRLELEQRQLSLEQSCKKLHARKSGCASAVAKILFFVPFIIFAITGWSVVIALLASGAGCIVGGIGYALLPIIGIGSGFLVQAGGGLVCTGVGIVLFVVSTKLLKLFWTMTKRYFGSKPRATESNGIA